MSKPREFWINDNAEGDETKTWSESPWFGYIHVIEYSAYENAIKLHNAAIAIADAVTEERDATLAKLAQRHIIGKVYEINRETVNRLAGELDTIKKERDEYRTALEYAARQYADGVYSLPELAEEVLAKYPKRGEE